MSAPMSAPVLAPAPAPVGLPGIALPDRTAGPRPGRLLSPGVLLLAGVEPGRHVPLGEHLRRWGAMPERSLDELIAAAEGEGLVGAGGADFPTARKLGSLSGANVTHVVVNGAEGETASGKDGVLLGHVPHLVLDGAVAAARALGARRIVVRISADRPDLARVLAIAVTQRHDGPPIEVSVGPAAFAAGEATAVIRALAGGPALPADLGRPPTMPSRGLRRRSLVMLSNVETFARLAVAARGMKAASALASASGAVRAAGVVELPVGSTLADLATAAGGLMATPEVLITGGWHGRWVRWDHDVAAAPLSRGGLTGVGGRWGAGAFVWVPQDIAPIAALAGVAAELAAGSAGQCGPCWRGLPEVAAIIARAVGHPIARDSVEEVLAEIDGRGICAHPSAAAAAVRSALDLIGTDARSGRSS